MLSILLGFIPSLLIRYILLGRPASKMEAFGISFCLWLFAIIIFSQTSDQETKAFYPLISAASVGSFFILRQKRSKRELLNSPQDKAQKMASKKEDGYIVCSYCGFEQWGGYTECQRCNAKF